MWEGDNEGGYIGGGSSHAAFVKALVRDLVEDVGIENEFPTERTVEFMVIRTVVRSGNVLDVSPGIFMG